MAEVKFAFRYTAEHDGQRLGPWEKGEVVDLPDDLVEWLEHDAPGVVTSKGRKAKADEVVEVPADGTEATLEGDGSGEAAPEIADPPAEQKAPARRSRARKRAS